MCRVVISKHASLLAALMYQRISATMLTFRPSLMTASMRDISFFLSFTTPPRQGTNAQANQRCFALTVATVPSAVPFGASAAVKAAVVSGCALGVPVFLNCDNMDGWILRDNSPCKNSRRISAARSESPVSCGAGQYCGGASAVVGGTDDGARFVVGNTEKICGYSLRELIRLIDKCGSGPRQTKDY